MKRLRVKNEIKQKEFCRLTGLTRKSLALYEERKLLVPSRIDLATGYRYYNTEEILLGQRISFLRTFSFTTDEISNLIEDSEHSWESLQQRKTTLLARQNEIINGLNFIEVNGQYPFPMTTDLRETTLNLGWVATIEGVGSAKDIALHHTILQRRCYEAGVVITGLTGTYFFADSTEEQRHFKVFVTVKYVGIILYDFFSVEEYGAPHFTFYRHFGCDETLVHSYKRLNAAIAPYPSLHTGEYLEIYRNRTKATPEITLITDIGVPLWL